jgi:hypothetical protein
MSAPERLALLRRALRERPGPWTTREVQKLYRAHHHAAPLRKTARDDLAKLHREGLLTQHEEPGRRFYTLNTWNGAGS